jgi:hypothetical protein
MANLNTIKRAQKIKNLVNANYEAGRQDRCKRQVFKNIVSKEYPMSERTFWRYLNLEQKERQAEFDKRQLNIDFKE